MNPIPVQDARELFTKTLIDVFVDSVEPTAFLRSYFPDVISATKNISIQVRRGFEKISVNVERGTEGTGNKFTKSTEKVIEPPYYKEFFLVSQLDLYDRVFGSDGTISLDIFNQFVAAAAEKMSELRAKIERALEKQCADIFHTGKILLKNNITIDFARKPESIVTLPSGDFWTVSGKSPYDDIEDGCIFLRTVGKAQGSMFNAIMGRKALNAMLANDVFLKRNDLKNMSLDAIVAPQRNAVGASLHGVITAGTNRVAIWSYPEYFDDKTGKSIPYIDEDKVIILPEKTQFKMAFAAVPRLLNKKTVNVVGNFVIGEFFEDRTDSHGMDIKSAACAVPTSIDKIYTLKPVAK